MKVYKGTDKNMKCREFQYELGKTVKDDGAVRCGNKGFHSCEAPLDVLRYYPMREGNRYFAAEADGVIDRAKNEDSKIASSELTLKTEISVKDLIKAHFEFTRKKAESGTKGGDSSNLAGGDRSNLAGGYSSNLAGGDSSNLAGGDSSNLAGGYSSNLAGGDSSNLAGGDRSNLAGGDWSILKCGKNGNIIARNAEKASGGIGSVIAFTDYGYIDGEYTLIAQQTIVIDGEIYKPDTWYAFKDGKVVEVE